MAVRLSALRAGRPLPPGRFLVLKSVRVWADPRAIVRLEWLGHLKNPMTSLEVEPATFRLVAASINFRLRWRIRSSVVKYSVGAPFKSRPGHRLLSLTFLEFFSVHWGEYREPQPHPSRPFPIHHSFIIQFFLCLDVLGPLACPCSELNLKLWTF
jgi:hypothetical protein